MHGMLPERGESREISNWCRCCSRSSHARVYIISWIVIFAFVFSSCTLGSGVSDNEIIIALISCSFLSN